jgi:chaperone required for assembly of F1-ATPase
MITAMTEKTIDVANDDPRAIAKQIHDFRRSAVMFSSDAPRMIEKYEDKWIAVLDGVVRAEAHDFEALFAEILAQGISRQHVLVRHVQRDERTLIL